MPTPTGWPTEYILVVVIAAYYILQVLYLVIVIYVAHPAIPREFYRELLPSSLASCIPYHPSNIKHIHDYSREVVD